jgi:hypothetical protein
MTFPLMYEHQFSINTNPGGTSTMAPIAEGISNVEPANNEQLDQTRYISGQGFASTDVIGAQLTLIFTGHRKDGDAAQDYIFGTILTLGAGRRTDFEWTLPNGDMFSGPCTIANISPSSGDAGAKGEITFEIHFNEKPTFTPAV